jgi:hypothetical protein
MKNIAIGDKVNVTILKNGYFQGEKNGIVEAIKKDKIKVKCWQTGSRWYAQNNVRPRIRK